MSKVYTRTEETETKRRLAQAKTWYAKLQEKNRAAEAEYEAKIAKLERDLMELSGEAEHQHQLQLALQQERNARAAKCTDPWEAEAIRQGLAWT